MWRSKSFSYSKLEEKKLISAIKKSFLVSQNADFLKYKKSKSGFIDFLPTCNLVVKDQPLKISNLWIVIYLRMKTFFERKYKKEWF